MLVRFRDVGDPKSVEVVDAGDLAKSFGPGVKLRRIMLAVTDDPATTGIEKRLGWVVDKFYYDKMLDGQALNNGSSLANNLTPESFKKGDHK